MANVHDFRYDEEQFQLAFGDQTNIPRKTRDHIFQIRYKMSFVNRAYLLDGSEVEHFSDLAWELFGRYIAKNANLQSIIINGLQGHLADAQMSYLFRGLLCSISIRNVVIRNNHIGIDGIRSMVPFLRNASTLSKINLSRNRNVKTEGFNVLINALDGRPIEELHLEECDIMDISVSGNCTLPHLRELHLDDNKIQNMGGISALQNHTNLQSLYLKGNDIGRDACIQIGTLLQKEGSSLSHLYLGDNNIDDEGAEILAASLKHNKTLKRISLDENSLSKRGFLAFLKLLNDISSIKNTYKSNHTLEEISIKSASVHASMKEIESQIQSAIDINMNSPDSAGKRKIIKYQLNSQRREKICKLQNVDSPYSSIFADIDPVLLPDILAFVGDMCGQKNLYCALVATTPELTSIINRKALLHDTMAKNAADITALDAAYVRLTAKRVELNKRMAYLEMGDSKQPAIDKDEEQYNGLSGQKPLKKYY